MKRIRFRPLTDSDPPQLGEEYTGYLVEYKGIKLVVLKEEINGRVWWSVYELSTHLYVTRGDVTRKGALERAIRKIEEKGLQRTKRVIEEQRKRYAAVLNQ